MSNPFLDGIGKVLGKVSDQFQTREERNKNEHSRLTQEREKLRKMRPFNEKISRRLTVIDARIAELDGMFKNSSK